MELVDMLGLEPSALRCAGSSPVPGKTNFKTLKYKFSSKLSTVRKVRFF